MTIKTLFGAAALALALPMAANASSFDGCAGLSVDLNGGDGSVINSGATGCFRLRIHNHQLGHRFRQFGDDVLHRHREARSWLFPAFWNYSSNDIDDFAAIDVVRLRS